MNGVGTRRLLATLAVTAPLATGCSALGGVDSGTERPANLASLYPATPLTPTRHVETSTGHRVWSTKMPSDLDPTQADLLTVGGWYAALQMESGGRSVATAVVGDASNGKILKTLRFPQTVAWPTVAEAGGRPIAVVVRGLGKPAAGSPPHWRGYVVSGYDALTRQRLWTRDAAMGVGRPGPRTFLRIDGIADGRVIGRVGGDDHRSLSDQRLVSLDLLTGRDAWLARPGWDFRSVDVGHGLVAVAYRADGNPALPSTRVRTLDAGDGKQTADFAWEDPGDWTWPTAQILSPTRMLLGGYGRVATPGDTRQAAIATETGRILWKWPAWRIPVVNLPEQVVVLPREDGGFSAFELSSGAALWEYSAQKARETALTIAFSRGGWLTGDTGRRNVVLDPRSGDPVLLTDLELVGTDQWNERVLVHWSAERVISATAGTSAPLGILPGRDGGSVLFIDN